MNVDIIARVRTPYAEKFGTPRQSGLARSRGEVVFEPAYRSADAVRGLAGFSHIWLLWQFDRNGSHPWSPTVRPPRLGGNQRMGVFATRSPYRPNPIGLSCVALEGVELTAEGPVLHIAGADLVDGTPILDIKPYLPYCDSHPEATSGWTEGLENHPLAVDISEALAAMVGDDLPGLIDVLAGDPRPRYQKDPTRAYGLTYGKWNVTFRVAEGKAVVEKITAGAIHESPEGR